MTRQEVIELAKQAGLAHFYDSEGHCTGVTNAVLIDADKERNDDRLVEMLMPFAKLVAEKEREACAKRLDAVGAWHCADNIRLRGQE